MSTTIDTLQAATKQKMGGEEEGKRGPKAVCSRCDSDMDSREPQGVRGDDAIGKKAQSPRMGSSLTGSRDSLEKHEDDGQSLDCLHHCLKGEARAPMGCENSESVIAMHVDRGGLKSRWGGL
jgi:hypothetical protein